jgi:hypothetical protein
VKIFNFACALNARLSINKLPGQHPSSNKPGRSGPGNQRRSSNNEQICAVASCISDGLQLRQRCGFQRFRIRREEDRRRQDRLLSIEAYPVEVVLRHIRK